MPNKFRCEIECDRYDDWCLRITHNGYQWTAINIESIVEANAIIELLQVWVEDMESFAWGCGRAGNGRDARHVLGWIEQVVKGRKLNARKLIC